MKNPRCWDNSLHRIQRPCTPSVDRSNPHPPWHQQPSDHEIWICNKRCRLPLPRLPLPCNNNINDNIQIFCPLVLDLSPPHLNNILYKNLWVLMVNRPSHPRQIRVPNHPSAHSHLDLIWRIPFVGYPQIPSIVRWVNQELLQRLQLHDGPQLQGCQIRIQLQPQLALQSLVAMVVQLVCMAPRIHGPPQVPTPSIHPSSPPYHPYPLGIPMNNNNNFGSHPKFRPLVDYPFLSV